ncbi:hypothetical protein L596_000905 [Steinernema carpocapsae]|uniref:Uncharacterized protein n=1 Tax=Steinernema carpocapsae TaxID=34508 RepID=A0A4U8UK85_STECR|nr:hypothetical protein L596_000905 [Steinernema carpocapsae]
MSILLTPVVPNTFKSNPKYCHKTPGTVYPKSRLIQTSVPYLGSKTRVVIVNAVQSPHSHNKICANCVDGCRSGWDW